MNGIYTAVNGVWRRFGYADINPSPDVSTVYPALLRYPADASFPGTGA